MDRLLPQTVADGTALALWLASPVLCCATTSCICLAVRFPLERHRLKWLDVALTGNR